MTLTLLPGVETTPVVEGSRALWVPPPPKLKNGDHGRDKRRASAIRAYIGRNGAGKSQWAVHDLLPDIAAGRPILSTVQLLMAETGEPYEGCEVLNNFDQVLSFRHGVVFFDEIVGIAGSRESQSLPVQVQNHLNQLRRDDVAQVWTAPSWKRADTIIRETTQLVTLCRASLPKRAFSADGTELLWRQNRWFGCRSYDASEFEEWSQAKEGKLKTESSGHMWGPSSRARYSYDTYAPVSKVALENEVGRCVSCGGYRARKKCTCAA